MQRDLEEITARIKELRTETAPIAAKHTAGEDLTEAELGQLLVLNRLIDEKWRIESLAQHAKHQ
jgi:hypothetical protein